MHLCGLNSWFGWKIIIRCGRSLISKRKSLRRNFTISMKSDSCTIDRNSLFSLAKKLWLGKGKRCVTLNSICVRTHCSSERKQRAVTLGILFRCDGHYLKWCVCCFARYVTISRWTTSKYFVPLNFDSLRLPVAMADGNKINKSLIIGPVEFWLTFAFINEIKSKCASGNLNVLSSKLIHI